MQANHFFLALCAAVLTLPSVAQEGTWEVGSTTLTEYDLATGIDLPWEILWGPDDHIWCSTRPGKVLRIDPQTGTYTEILEKSVMGSGSGEGGMLGMCLHPNFDTDPYVYIVYCTGSAWTGSEQLSRFTWNGTELVDEEVILDDIPAGGIHNGSRVLVLPDNTLLMTTGDVGDGDFHSQNPNTIAGKTLRLNLDGSIPADNPDPTSYVYSIGHRNAQGLCLGPNGLIYSSEHGQSNWDEFNIITPDANYGWPEVEGPCNTSAEQEFCAENDVTEPLKTWSPCVAVNGIEYYNHEAIPEWQNSVLMAVLGGLSGVYERLSVLHMNDDGTVIDSEDQYFSEFNQRIRDICVNPHTGAVYVALNGPGYPGSGPNTIKEFVNESYVSVNELKGNAPAVTVFPNPVDASGTIAFDEGFIGGKFTVMSFEGKVVDQRYVEDTQMIFDASSWAAGNYFIRVESAFGIATQTFVVR
ncbi:MAG: PQQ-dependent sugar dehydrogenase [Flavobacteriales bacterium]